MRYCFDTTVNHPCSLTLPETIVNVNTILAANSLNCVGYVLPAFLNGEVAIDMDRYEMLKAQAEGRNQNRSVDMVFGLRNNLGNREMILVELRLNYLNPNNLDKTELDEKVSSSASLLGNHINIHRLIVFIFKSSVLQEARNRLFRMNPRVNSNYVVMDVEQLKSNYFF